MLFVFKDSVGCLRYIISAYVYISPLSSTVALTAMAAQICRTARQEAADRAAMIM